MLRPILFYLDWFTDFKISKSVRRRKKEKKKLYPGTFLKLVLSFNFQFIGKSFLPHPPICPHILNATLHAAHALQVDRKIDTLAL
jgi:hypothetical protein